MTAKKNTTVGRQGEAGLPLQSPAGLRMSRAERVHRHIVDRILRGELQPGQRLEPVRDVVRRTGVSHASVAAAFKSLAREGWIVAHAGRGSFVVDAPPLHLRERRAESAQGEVGGGSAGGSSGGNGTVFVLGALTPNPRQGSHLFQILAGIQLSCEAHGWRTRLMMINDIDVAAVIRSTPDLVGMIGSDAVAPSLQTQGLALDNYVYFGLYPDAEPATAVIPDNSTGAVLATRYLLERGHRRIACVTGQAARPPGVKGPLPVIGRYFALRVHGWRQALLATGLTPPEPVPWNVRNPEAVEQVRNLLAAARRRDRKAPTALLVGNDVMAAEILEAAAEMGVRVPGHISIIGYENWDMSADTAPPLTTVDYPKRLMGEECVSRLAWLRQRPDTRGCRTLVPMSIVERASVASVR